MSTASPRAHPLRSFALGFCLMAALLAPARPAAAEDGPWAKGVSADDQERALAIFRDGNGHFESSEYSQALVRYRAAIQIWDHPGIHFNIAVCLVHLDRPLEAHRHFELALRYGERALGSSAHSQALTYRKLLEDRLARVRVVTEQSDVVITLDGEEFLVGPGEKTAMVVAGSHQLVANKTGLVPLVRTVDATAGETSEEWIMMTRMQRRWNAALPWIVIGSGIALGAAGAALEYRSEASYDRYDRALAEACPSGCRLSEVGDEVTGIADRARLENRLGVATLAVAGAAVLGGVALLVINRQQAVPDESSITISPMFGENTAGLQLEAPWR